MSGLMRWASLLLGVTLLLSPVLTHAQPPVRGFGMGRSMPGMPRQSGPPQKKHALPNEAQNSMEGQTVLAQGAKRLDLGQYNTYAVYWFPPNYAKLDHHRVMFVLSGTMGNAYEGVYHQLAWAKQHGYGVIALQWWMGGDTYLEPKVIESAFTTARQQLAKTYPINTQQMALETFSRSGSISYEIAYWNHQLKHPAYRLILVQSGGIPEEHPRPLITKMIAGQLGPKPLSGDRFFMYCGMKDNEWGAQMCAQMHHAETILTQAGGRVIYFIEDPNGGHGGMHNVKAHSDTATAAFLLATQ